MKGAESDNSCRGSCVVGWKDVGGVGEWLCSVDNRNVCRLVLGGRLAGG